MHGVHNKEQERADGEAHAYTVTLQAVDMLDSTWRSEPEEGGGHPIPFLSSSALSSRQVLDGKTSGVFTFNKR